MIIKHDFFVEATEPKRSKPKDTIVRRSIEENINKQIIEASLEGKCKCQKKKS